MKLLNVTYVIKIIRAKTVWEIIIEFFILKNVENPHKKLGNPLLILKITHLLLKNPQKIPIFHVLNVGTVRKYIQGQIISDSIFVDQIII